MRRTFLLTVLAVCFVVGPSRPASAQWWSWMEEYSGPGSFGAKSSSLLISVVCQGKGNSRAADAAGYFERAIGLSSADARWCVNLDLHGFRADPEPGQGYPQIDARVYEIGASLRLHRSIDVGMGAGWISFTADPDGLDITTNKFLFTPLRVVLKPAMLFSDYDSNRQRAVASIVKVFFKESYVAGLLTGADFGAPANPFQVDGEFIANAGVMVDVFEVLRALK